MELLDTSVDFVIGNKLAKLDPFEPLPTCSHVAAKGRNDLKGKEIASIITYPALEQYDEWAILGVAFDISNPIQLAFKDIVIQDVGRNTGFRRSWTSSHHPHTVYIKPSLYRDLNFFQVGSVSPFKFFNKAA